MKLIGQPRLTKTIWLAMLLAGCGRVTSNETASDSTTVTMDTLSHAIKEDGMEGITESGFYDIQDTEIIFSPYDFPLDADSIKARLGGDAVVTVKEFEAGEDYSAFSITTVKKDDNEISFYSFSGKHSADISTSKLPLVRGIVVGMSKDAFLKVFNLPKEAAGSDAFQIIDQFGSITFTFASDLLTNIHIYYEEGD